MVITNADILILFPANRVLKCIDAEEVEAQELFWGLQLAMSTGIPRQLLNQTMLWLSIGSITQMRSTIDMEEFIGRMSLPVSFFLSVISRRRHTTAHVAKLAIFHVWSHPVPPVIAAIACNDAA